MSEIISISVPGKMPEEIDLLVKEFGFSGRSEAIRQGINLLESELRQAKIGKGTLDAILIIVHDDSHDTVSRLSHKFGSEIKTRLHHHLSNGKCMELFILRGAGKKILEMANSFRASKKIGFVKLVAQ